MEQVINNLVINLNSIGRGFCDYAGNMFVQSSLLIILLLIIDFLLRKRVRAVFRYCAWMLVFVKLILPPSLCLPTGIGYWCGGILSSEQTISKPISNTPSVEPFKPIMPEQIEISAKSPKAGPVQPIPEVSASAPTAVSNLPSLTWQGIVFLIWLVGVLVFSALLIQRLFFVRSLLLQSKPAKGRLLDTLNQCSRQVGISRSIELKLSNTLQSPAVCGLAKPVILMPSSLLEKLTSDKLRAVLIHELAHIKRGDLWVNLAQTVLQIIYFYNPFVWLANAVVRRIREQAVDEMVLVALGAEAESYSNTLIDIAEMVFWRANLSLRLIGVAESKKALHRRIKHMLTRPIPKTAKLGFLGLLVVAILAAVLLPMAAAATEDNKKEESSFTATLPNGVTVELVGICEHPSAGKQWWRPDGSVLERAPYEKSDSSITPMTGRKAREIAISIEDFDNDIGFRYEIEGVQNSASSGSGDQKTYCIVFDQAEGNNKTDISVGIAAGQWETVMTQEPNFEGVHSYNEVIWHGPGEKEGKTVLHTAHTMVDKNTCVIVVDHSGKEHIGSSNSAMKKGLESVQTTFSLPLSQIKEFKFQTRPYQWVIFKNVSLKPDVKTNVQVEAKQNIAKQKEEEPQQEKWQRWTEEMQLWGQRMQKWEKDKTQPQPPMPKMPVMPPIPVSPPETMPAPDVNDSATLSAILGKVLPEMLNEMMPKVMGGVNDLKILEEEKDLLEKEIGKVKTEANQLQGQNASKKEKEAVERKIESLQYRLDVTNKKLEEQTELFEKDMEQWGEQFGKRMEQWGEQFGKQMEGWGEQFGKQLEEQIQQWVEQFVKKMMSTEFSDKLAVIEKEFSASIGAIDVAIEDFKIKPYPEGGLYSVIVSIRNKGSRASPAFGVYFYRGDPDKVKPMTHGAGPIKPGDIWNEASMPFALKEGVNDMVVAIDPENAIAESDETNNRASMTIIIKDGNIVEQSVKFESTPDKGAKVEAEER